MIFQSANQIFQLSGEDRYHWYLKYLRETVDFQRPKRQYPERPRPVSTVYFYQSEYQ